MNAVQCPTMAAASGLSETMILDDDSGAHEESDDDNGDDGYGIESHCGVERVSSHHMIADRFRPWTTVDNCAQLCTTVRNCAQRSHL